MTPSSSSHCKRSIAMTMLFVWAFALLAGVANACLTEPRGELTHPGLSSALPDHPVQAPRHSHVADPVAHAAQAAEHHQPDQRPDKAPCLKSCDESAQMLLKQAPKVDTPDLQLVALPSRPWAGELLQAPAVPGRALVAALPPPSPPLRVQFSRLAL